MTQFLAEVASLGHLRHRNLVQLLSYCRRKGKLLLVYDFMANGSLDKYIYGNSRVTLNCKQRFKVIKGVASGLLYLHEQWEQVMIHRDVKAGNVLLDGELNGRLGDFGLARLYDHNTDPQTTHLVETLGYLAPGHARTNKPTTSTDVYAFGVFTLEVATSRQPFDPKLVAEDFILLDWVFSCKHKCMILEARDPNFGAEFVAEEVGLVLKLGLLCSHSEATVLPSMCQVIWYLEGDMQLPDLSALGLSSSGLTFANSDSFNCFAGTHPFSVGTSFDGTSSVAESLLSGGR